MFPFAKCFTAKNSKRSTICIAQFVGWALLSPLAGVPAASAQVAPAANAPGKAVLAPPTSEAGSRWSALSPTQQTVLKPLAALWESMDVPQQRKWLALTQTYPKLAPADQEKLKSRMVEWAGLSPKDRTTARLNFALTKTVDKADRAANWEAYQALPDEEKKKLAATAPGKPAGAAIAVKPVPPQKLAPVPVTRNSPPSERNAAVAQTPLNRYTLLPEPAPAPVLPAPEPEVAKP